MAKQLYANCGNHCMSFRGVAYGPGAKVEVPDEITKETLETKRAELDAKAMPASEAPPTRPTKAKEPETDSEEGTLKGSTEGEAKTDESTESTPPAETGSGTESSDEGASTGADAGSTEATGEPDAKDKKGK